MTFWIVETGEPVPGLDADAREWRAGILADALVSAGHGVTWWASTFDHAAKRHRCEAARTFSARPGLDIRLLHGPGYSRSISWRRVVHQRAIARAFAAEAASAPPPSMIFCCLPTPELAGEAVAAGRVRGVPVVVDVRDLWPDVYLTAVPRPLRPIGRLALAGEFRRVAGALAQAAGITAVSQAYLDWALALAGRPARETDGVYPLGYRRPAAGTATSDVRATVGIAPDALVLLFVGVFGASYDLETIVAAARALRASGDSRTTFVLAGDGDKAGELRRAADGLPNVVFTGWLDRDAVTGLLATASAGLVSYTGDALQSLPNKPFEYMAAGLPLVSSLGGELARLIEEERIGLSYRPGDVASLVAAVCQIGADEAAREAMGRRARAVFQQRFDADIIYPRLVRHLERLASPERLARTQETT